jgi:hypothetical protein
MHLMDNINHPNNARLQQLIANAGLSRSAALALFNLDQRRKYAESTWKAFLAKPDSARWRRLRPHLLARAESALTRPLMPA